jgi:hypothetical protein
LSNIDSDSIIAILKKENQKASLLCHEIREKRTGIAGSAFPHKEREKAHRFKVSIFGDCSL